MEALLYLALWGGLIFLMMRFGCGAHVDAIATRPAVAFGVERRLAVSHTRARGGSRGRLDRPNRRR